MQYSNITPATFLRRPNRFIAEVEVAGQKEIVHVKNTGRCKELLVPGCEVWLTEPGTPGRKTRYDLVAVRKNTGVLFNIDSQAPNQAVKEWLARQDFSRVIPEYRFGDSRIDFYMERSKTETDNQSIQKNKFDESINLTAEQYLMEVKGCTLEFDNIGYFPDAPTERGVKHIRELIRAREAGYRAILAFVIQMDGVREVRPNIQTHPEFGTAMDDARAAGVEIRFFQCHVEPDRMEIIGTSEQEAMEKRTLSIHEKYEFRSIRPEEAEEAAAIEAACFPPNEACSREHMLDRVRFAPKRFLVAVDKEKGKIAGFLNGIATNETAFQDIFFTDASTHDPAGKNIMLCGLDVLPQYRQQGLARELVHQYCSREKARGTQRLVLTCHAEKVTMYAKFGFRDLGESASEWGGEKWHEMDILLNP